MKLLQQFIAVAQRRRLAENTIDTYSLWVRHFLKFSADQHRVWKHPVELGTADVA